MTLKIRPAALEDAAVVHRLIQDLAAAQGQAASMVSSIDDIRRDGFGPAALFHAVLAEVDGHPRGLALYFFIYSTWQGRPALYVEDLIVTDGARGSGIGRALMQELARIAEMRHCSKLELSVSTENTARVFYERLGLNRKGDWIPYTISGAALTALAGE
ncbi:MAG: GNAT family N-acetyltransferase [Proteobacteria bacterium]|nr:GNAT family N-acetyltransferase [Pseudomonadota bacterium]